MKTLTIAGLLVLAATNTTTCEAVVINAAAPIKLVDSVDSLGEHVESIDLSGNTFIAGGDDYEAVVFTREGGTWQEETRLVPWDGNGRIFGYSVAASDDVAVVSNPWDNNFKGSIYVYERGINGWAPANKFTLPTSSSNEWLGEQVAADGDWIAGGAPRGRNALGTLHLFQRSNGTWAPHSELQSPDGNREDSFGDTVDLSTNRLIVGAPTNRVQDTIRGSAYIYRLVADVWQLEATLESPDPTETEFFGQRVAIDGSTAVVASTVNASAYVYEYDGNDWGHVATVTPSTVDNGNVSRTIDIDGDLIVVGALHDSSIQRDDGLATVYSRTSAGWSLLETLQSPLASSRDRYGLSVNIEESTLLVSAYGGEGSVFAYSVGTTIPEPTASIICISGVLAILGCRWKR